MVGWTARFSYVDPHQIERRLIRNPNYGGTPCEVPGTCVIPLVERKMKPKFFVALHDDVAKNGFRNPVLLYSTTSGLLMQFGGSRVRIAKQLDKEIPAIIIDYTGEYSSCEEVTKDNFHQFFRDEPELFNFTEYGVDTHYSLERNRRRSYDPKGMAWTEGLDDTEFLDEEFPWLREEP